jgi:hypothetical protein
VNIWRYEDPRAREKDVIDEMDISLEYVGEVALSVDALPDEPDYAKEWKRDYGKISQFTKKHGHSRIDESYRDEDGRPLAGLVLNLRWHHAGRAGGASRGPYPGIDYAADLDRLEHWTWQIEEPHEIAEMRSRRHDSSLLQSLGVRDGVEEAAFVRTITEAFRHNMKAPWPRIRELTVEHGIKPGSTALVDLVAVRSGQGYLGLLVASDRRCYSFFLGFGGNPEKPATWRNRVYLAEWRELAPTVSPEFRNQIELGMKYVDGTLN